MHARAYSIVCRREVQVSVSRMQYAMAMPSSWLRERCAAGGVLPPTGRSGRKSDRPVPRRAGGRLRSRQREKGSRRPVPAALRKASLAAKSAAALATVMAVRRPCPLPLPEAGPVPPAPPGRTPGAAKTAPWGPSRLFSILRNAAQVAADSVDHEKPPERGNFAPFFFTSNFQKFLGKVCKFQLGILKSALISCTMGYKFQ